MKKARILVVEDDRIIARSLRLILEQLGYEVTALASTGQAAIHEAEETKPDLILMDIVLDGEMDGIDGARVIRSNQSIPIVYLTAHADQTTRERSDATQPFGYLSKPIMKDDLRRIVDTGSTEAPRVNGRRMRIVSSPGNVFSLIEGP
jgi:CheY-like chemotaxis protein